MKGSRTDLSQAQCATSRALEIIGDWWSMLIVRDAFLGRQRFGEFQKSIGLAKNILSARLKKLVEDGVFRIERDEQSPSRRRYLLTERGDRLAVVLTALWQWGEENCFEPGELGVSLVEKATGQPLARLEIRTADGRPVDSQGLRMGLKDRAGRDVALTGAAAERG